MFRLLPATLLCTVALGGAAQAQSFGNADYAVSLGASTLGFTVEPSVRLNNSWGIRAPIGGMSFDFDDKISGESYEGNVDSAGIGLLADWYPMASSGFRLSVGVFYTDYSADLNAEDVNYNGTVSDARAHVTQKNHFLPALAVGYDGKIGQRGLLSLTVGGMFGNEFEVTGSESSGLVPQDEVDAEVNEIQNELDDYDIIPYIQISVGFQF